ncbi:MAG: hypothetical protein GC159_10705 [Phycisphaera sp.]|nr:hypothetical protein [Phycisphaera sp.]
MTHALASLVWRPLLPQLWVYGGAATLAALTLLVCVRTFTAQPRRAVWFASMRLGLITAIAVVMLGPSRELAPQVDNRKTQMVVCVDTSTSMQATDAGAGEPRLEHAVRRWLSDKQVAALGEQYQLSYRAFDDTRRTVTLDALRRPAAEVATGGVTHLAGSLNDVLLDLPTLDAESRLLVISDGHDTDRQPLGPVIKLAKERHVPIHTVAVGTATSPPDIAVIAQPRQEYLLVNEEGQIVVKLLQAGLDDATVNVRVRRGDDVSEHAVKFAGRSTASLTLPIRHDAPGVYEYDVSVAPVAGEKVTANNEHTLFVDVFERSMRVLVMEGEPYWDTKFIAQSLRTDPRIELTHITQLGPKKREGVVTRVDEATEPAPPVTIEQMRRYDVIVLGRGIEHLMPPDAIGLFDTYVNGGGKLVLARGRAYDVSTDAGRAAAEAMAIVEPVAFSGGVQRDVPLELAPSGVSSPSFTFASVPDASDRVVRAMPAMSTLYEVSRVKPAAQVLARASRRAVADGAGGGGGDASTSQPAIVTMPVGRGRVFAVLGDGLWRWSLLPQDMARYRGVFDSFWSNTIRSLVAGGDLPPGQKVSIKLSRTSVRLGDPILVDVAAKIPPDQVYAPVVRVTAPDGTTRAVPIDQVGGQSNRQRGTLDADAVGVWTVTLEPDALHAEPVTRRFSVYDLDLERLDPAARPAQLKMLAEETGGLSFSVDDDVDLAALLSRERIASLAPPRTEYVWDRAWILFVMLAWAGLEWIGRRWSGWL